MERQIVHCDLDTFVCIGRATNKTGMNRERKDETGQIFIFHRFYGTPS